MGGLLSAISGQFAKAIILGTLFPVLIVSALNIFLVAPLFPQTVSLPAQLLKIAFGDDKWGAVILTFIVLLITGLLYNLNIPIIRLYEGYPWEDSLVGKFFGRLQARRFAEASSLRSSASWLRAKLPPGDPLLSRAEKQDTDLLQLLNSDFPESQGLLLPTRLGNVIRCFERYPFLAYGMEAIVIWPRLIAKIDSGFASTIDEAKTSFDFMLNTSFLSGLTACVILAIGLGKPSPLSWTYFLPWVWRVLFFGGLARIFYWLSISRAYPWGDQVRAAFDLYRFDLLKEMGYVRRPLTNQEERALWCNISNQLLYATITKVPVPYEEPSVRLIPFPSDIRLSARRVYTNQQQNLRIEVVLYLHNLDQLQKALSLTVIEQVPDGYKYVPDTATVSSGLLNVSRLSPLEFFIGPVLPNSIVKIKYAIKPAPP
jgi:hypothetical protein